MHCMEIKVLTLGEEEWIVVCLAGTQYFSFGTEVHGHIR